jgi:hypothetical protein
MLCSQNFKTKEMVSQTQMISSQTIKIEARKDINMRLQRKASLLQKNRNKINLQVSITSFQL